MKQREIKFKFYDKKRKKLIEECDMWGNYTEFLNEDDVIPMQFTGLKDKNGKEIWEGDILKWIDNSNYPSGNIQVVKFKEYKVYPLVSAPSGKCWEIIGNIYENPELLK